MGCNKALIQFLGQPLIQRVMTRLAPAADELLITGNQPELFSFLQVPVYPDLYPGLGALGGLFTALSVAKYPLVAVVACDMAFANPDLLLAERDALISHGVEAVVPQTEAGCEPFHAVYSRETCRISVGLALDAGKRRADAWYSEVNVLYFTPQQIQPYDPKGEAFININTPQELLQAEAYARRFEIAQSEQEKIE